MDSIDPDETGLSEQDLEFAQNPSDDPENNIHLDPNFDPNPTTSKKDKKLADAIDLLQAMQNRRSHKRKTPSKSTQRRKHRVKDQDSDDDLTCQIIVLIGKQLSDVFSQKR